MSQPSTSPGRVVLAGFVGTAIEWYDFFLYGNLGATDEQLMTQYEPPLTREELDAAWRYAALHPDEIAADIRDNDEDA